MADGEGLDSGLSAARHHAPWSDLAVHRPGHGALAHLRAQLAAAADPRSVIVTADALILLRPWAVGFVGEEKVGLELALLEPEWRVLHSVTVGRDGADIDHLVIGPPGVFTIDTKSQPGAQVDVRGNSLLIGSRHTSYVRTARHEAHRVRATLAADLPDACPVTAIICVVGASPREQVTSEDFWVVDDQGLVPALNGLAPVLTAEQVERLFERARRSTTWTTLTPPPAAPVEVAAFARELAAAPAPTGRKARPLQAPPGSPPPGSALVPGPPSQPRPSSGQPRPGGPGGPAGPALPARQRPHRALVLLAVIALVVVLPAISQRAAHMLSAVVALSVPQGTAATTETSAYRASPDLPVETVHQSCTVEGEQGRTLLSSQLLTCQPDALGALVWEYANPWRRLPVALQGTHCTTVGEHARNFSRGDSALVCTATDDIQNRWIGDPDWTPPA